MFRQAVDLRAIQPGRVCIIKPSSLGDVVHALPVLAALRDRWPGARFSWVVNRGLRSLLDGNPHLDEVIPFDRGRMRPTPSGLAALTVFLAGLRSRRFDLTIDLQGLLRSGVMAAATGARVRVGLAGAREGAGRFCTHRVEDRPGVEHAVDRLLLAAEAFGADVSAPRFDVPIAPEDRRWARSILAHLPRPLLVINPGARWMTKRWPVAHFAEVARRASVELGAGLAVVGGPEDRPLAVAFRAALGPIPAIDLAGATTLPRLAAVAAEADLVLSNDTGPLHLAAAAGATVLGIYTCTSPAKTGPYGPNAQTISSCVWCAPSFIKTCARLDCFRELGPDRVWAAVRPRLAPPGRISRSA